jgi:hypothetical protein
VRVLGQASSKTKVALLLVPLATVLVQFEVVVVEKIEGGDDKVEVDDETKIILLLSILEYFDIILRLGGDGSSS